MYCVMNLLKINSITVNLLDLNEKKFYFLKSLFWLNVNYRNIITSIILYVV